MTPLTTIAVEIHQTKPFSSRRQEATVALLRTACLLHHRLESAASPHGLTLQQYNVLRILRGAGTAMPTMAIAERLVEPTPGITRILGRLQKAGLITRARGINDARQVLVAITPRGVTALAGCQSTVDPLDETCLATLDEDELGSLLGLLDRVRAGIRATAEARPDLLVGTPANHAAHAHPGRSARSRPTA